jgi:hypothetical protein
MHSELANINQPNCVLLVPLRVPFTLRTSPQITICDDEQRYALNTSTRMQVMGASVVATRYAMGTGWSRMPTLTQAVSQQPGSLFWTALGTH